jgi:hypothetical protein
LKRFHNCKCSNLFICLNSYLNPLHKFISVIIKK